jgi:hypothetical protein
MAHDHAHHHGAVQRRPAPSLFRMSAAARLGIAAAISAVIWAAIAWALA